MKTKYWLMLLSGLFLVSAVAAVFLYLYRPPANFVRVLSDGKPVAVLDLSQDTTLTVRFAGGYNTVTVQGGKVCVTDADCPDKYCMQSGARSSGLPIVCLPNHLVLQFSAQGELDGVVR